MDGIRGGWYLLCEVVQLVVQVRSSAVIITDQGDGGAELLAGQPKRVGQGCSQCCVLVPSVQPGQAGRAAGESLSAHQEGSQQTGEDSSACEGTDCNEGEAQMEVLAKVKVQGLVEMKVQVKIQMEELQ